LRRFCPVQKLWPGAGPHISSQLRRLIPNKEERDGHDEGWDIYFLKPMKEWLESND
jgi:hypothetical protein